MKSIASAALFALAAFIAVGNLSAQDRAVQATVPFNFVAGNTVLPAGTYIVSPESPEMVMVRNKDHWNLVGVVWMMRGDPQYAGIGKLVFTQYGDLYFLSEIHCPSMAADLPVSRLENRIRTREASLGQPQRVLLALN